MKRRITQILAVFLILCVLPVSAWGASGEEPVEITYMMMVEADFQEEDNPVALKFEEETGVRLKFEIAPESAYLERLQILFSSGDTLPNIIYMPNGQNAMFRNAVEKGMIIPLDEWLADAPNIKRYTDPLSWPSMDVMSDGKTYGLPKATQNRMDGMFVRKDWLDKFGMSIPENEVVTMDFFMDMLRKFTFEDPDGNGQNDTYGLSLDGANGIRPSGPFDGTFGLHGWQKTDGGEYEYMSERYSKGSGKFKDELSFFASLWAEGLVDPSWPNNTGGMQRTRLAQGIVGAATGSPGGLISLETQAKENFPDAELAYIARVVLNESDVPTGVGFGNGAWGCMVITKSALDEGKVDAIFDLLEYQLSDPGWDIVCNGLEGRDYQVVDGQKVFKDTLEAAERYHKQDKGIFCMLRRYDDVRFGVGPAYLDEAEADRVTKTILPTTQNLIVGLDLGYQTSAQSLQSFLDYNKVEAETIAKIIVGELPVEAWDECLDGWYAAGGQTLVEEMNEYLKANAK